MISSSVAFSGASTVTGFPLGVSTVYCFGINVAPYTQTVWAWRPFRTTNDPVSGHRAEHIPRRLSPDRRHRTYRSAALDRVSRIPAAAADLADPHAIRLEQPSLSSPVRTVPPSALQSSPVRFVHPLPNQTSCRYDWTREPCPP